MDEQPGDRDFRLAAILLVVSLALVATGGWSPQQVGWDDVIAGAWSVGGARWLTAVLWQIWGW